MALTGNITVARRGQRRGCAFAYGILANETIYTGSLLLVNAAGNVGRIQTIGAAGKFVGIANSGFSNVGGAAGAANIVASQDELALTVPTATPANINQPVYATDDGTLTLTVPGTGFVGLVGYLIGIDQQNGQTYVQLSGH